VEIQLLQTFIKGRKKYSLATFLVIIPLIAGGFAVYGSQSETSNVEIKEPLEILDYPADLTLYPGETIDFNVTVQNYASVTYPVLLDFRLNDTNYQSKYVTFMDNNYIVKPGAQQLAASLRVALNAPSTDLLMMINLVRKPQPEVSPSPSPETPPTLELQPSLELLAGGARWAAREGKSALYVNWMDNWNAHHLSDGANWEWFPEWAMQNWRSSITTALEQVGFNVTLAGDIPDDFGSYDLIILFAYYAVEPKHEPLIRDYVLNGGSLVMLAATQEYLTVHCKSLSIWASYLDYSSGGNISIQEWFGCGGYANAGGTASPAFDYPFETSLSMNDIIFTGVPSHAGVNSLNGNATVIAFWSSGEVFAFTYESGAGRIYYQAIVDQI
jgi:hypothetical protein